MEETKKGKSVKKTGSTKQSEKAPKSAPLAHGVGRRKSSVARVFLRRGSGNIFVNKKLYSNYFDTEVARLDAHKPFIIVPSAMHYDAEVNVTGGGLNSQAGAVKLGISRALVSLDDSIRSTLRSHGLLTVDSRVKERKKYGQKAARAKFQFTKR